VTWRGTREISQTPGEKKKKKPAEGGFPNRDSIIAEGGKSRLKKKKESPRKGEKGSVKTCFQTTKSEVSQALSFQKRGDRRERKNERRKIAPEWRGRRAGLAKGEFPLEKCGGVRIDFVFLGVCFLKGSPSPFSRKEFGLKKGFSAKKTECKSQGR